MKNKHTPDRSKHGTRQSLSSDEATERRLSVRGTRNIHPQERNQEFENIKSANVAVNPRFKTLKTGVFVVWKHTGADSSECVSQRRAGGWTLR